MRRYCCSPSACRRITARTTRSDYQKIYDDLRLRYGVGVGALMNPKLALDLSYFQPDGIHPNALAQPLLLDNVWIQLTPLLGH